MSADRAEPQTCAVVVPLLNEAALLPRFLRSMDAQERRPERLVLVDDGSTDGSQALLAAFARDRDWVTLLERPVRPPTGDRLADAPELRAFLWAVDRLDGEFSVVAKMDADLELAPRHVAEVLAAFSADPSLGMAGTYLWVQEPTGEQRREEHPAHHVRGPTRFYRWSCFLDIAPIPEVLGWDGADEVRARAHGWRTRSIELSTGRTMHLRPTGAHDGQLRAYARWGVCAYAIGAHPLAVLAGALIRLKGPPPVIGSLAYVGGWAAARPRGVARVPEDIRTATRREQLGRLRSRRRALSA